MQAVTLMEADLAALDLMAQLAGMELVERWADWDRSEFTADSPSAVSIWVKP